MFVALRKHCPAHPFCVLMAVPEHLYTLYYYILCTIDRAHGLIYKLGMAMITVYLRRGELMWGRRETERGPGKELMGDGLKVDPLNFVVPSSPMMSFITLMICRYRGAHGCGISSAMGVSPNNPQ